MSHRQNRNQVALVDLRGATYRYPEFVLGPIDLLINPGSRVALVGRNGAGKTTLLNLLAGNLAAAEGTARLLGTARTAPDPSLRQDIALVPTKLLALHWMKVRQHFDFLAISTTTGIRPGRWHWPTRWICMWTHASGAFHAATA